MRKRVVSLAVALCLVFSASMGLTSCQEATSSEEVVIEPKPADTYDMAEGEGLGSKILQFAIDTSYAGATNIVSDCGLWAIKGIAKKMGLNFSDEEAYQKQVLERLSAIETDIQSLKNNVDWLLEQVTDNQYLNSYNNFLQKYTDLNIRVYDHWQYFLTIENNIKSGQFDKGDIAKSIDKLCAQIRGNETGQSRLDILTRYFAQAFINVETDTPALNQHSIIYIVERFINKASPYKDKRRMNFDEIMCAPYTCFYQATNLCLMEYSRILSRHGITSYDLSKKGDLVAYTGVENGKVVKYLNCNDFDRESFLRENKDNFGNYNDFKDLPAKNIALYNSNIDDIPNRISSVVKRFNTINNLFKDFLDDRYAGCEPNKKYLVYDDGSTQVTNKFVRTVTTKDFLSVDGTINDKANMYLNYDAFGNITRDEFIKFANAIRKTATYKKDDGKPGYYTWKKFFELNGYSFPNNNEADLLMLGAYWHGFNNYSDWTNNGFKTCNSFFLYSINLNTTIEDFCKNPSFTIWTYSFYAIKLRENSNCGPKFYEEWYLLESRNYAKGEGHGLLYDCSHSLHNNCDWSTRIYTIDGLSVNPRKGLVNTKEHSVTF